MELTLTRDLKTKTFSAGELYVNGVFQCWTLEDADRGLSPSDCSEKVYGETAIPTGRYEVIISFSNRFQKYMPLLLSVPCFEGIRIHSGNRPEDSEGCILVGRERTAGGAVSQSRVAFSELMAKLKKVEKKEKIFIEVK